jgi:hypothetical protein
MHAPALRDTQFLKDNAVGFMIKFCNNGIDNLLIISVPCVAFRPLRFPLIKANLQADYCLVVSVHKRQFTFHNRAVIRYMNASNGRAESLAQVKRGDLQISSQSIGQSFTPATQKCTPFPQWTRCSRCGCAGLIFGGSANLEGAAAQGD